jgi:hypothetical protein
MESILKSDEAEEVLAGKPHLRDGRNPPSEILDGNEELLILIEEDHES